MRLKPRIILVTVLILFVSTSAGYNLVFAQTLDCNVEIDPADPTSIEEIEVRVSFDFRTYPPHVDDFGSIVRNDNIFSVNVTLFVPREDEFVLQMVHTDSFEKNLGALDPGEYTFKVYVTTIYGSEESWSVDKRFTVLKASEATIPEFHPAFGFLLLLVLTAISASLMKKFGKT